MKPSARRLWQLAGSTIILFLSSAALAASAQAAAVQATPAAAAAQGCVLENRDAYRCATEPFRGRLASAQKIAMEADPLDRYTQRELRRLVERLSKHVAQTGEVADLTFVVVPAQQGPVSLGPGDRALVSLDVYARGGQQGRGTLVWQETLRGEGDRPWPLQVRALLDQFESRVRAELRAAAK